MKYIQIHKHDEEGCYFDTPIPVDEDSVDYLEQIEWLPTDYMLEYIMAASTETYSKVSTPNILVSIASIMSNWIEREKHGKKLKVKTYNKMLTDLGFDVGR